MSNKNTFIAILVIILVTAFFWLVAIFTLSGNRSEGNTQNGTTTIENFSQIGNLIHTTQGSDAWYLSFEKEGQPGLVVPLSFDKNSVCTVVSGTAPCNPVKFGEGDRVEVKGMQNANGVLVGELARAQTSTETGLSIKLYYYNPNLDQGPGGAQCGSDGLVAVKRVIPRTSTPIQDVINLLLRGEISDEERREGLTSEFPLSGVVLQSASLSNGTLTLTFNDPEHRTSGGSCRVNILREEIQATVKQWKEVKTVRILPSDLFQP